MAMKNLELAVAIDQELKTIGTPKAADISPSGSATKFEQRLIGTKWAWNGTFHVEFQAEGKSAGKGLTWKTVKPYTIGYSFPDGNHGTILFERALDKAAINEITSSGTKNPMTLYRITAFEVRRARSWSHLLTLLPSRPCACSDSTDCRDATSSDSSVKYMSQEIGNFRKHKRSIISISSPGPPCPDELQKQNMSV